jgi:hypothetical protein
LQRRLLTREARLLLELSLLNCALLLASDVELRGLLSLTECIRTLARNEIRGLLPICLACLSFGNALTGSTQRTRGRCLRALLV